MPDLKQLHALNQEGLYARLTGAATKLLSTHGIGADDHPAIPIAYAYRGIARYHMGQCEAAIEDLLRGAGDTSELQNEAAIVLSQCYACRCDFPRAIQVLTGQVDSTSHAVAPALYLERGIMNQCLGQHERAIADFTSVLSVDPLNTDAFFRRGVSLRLLKLYEAAAEDFLTAREIQPDDATFHLNFKDPNKHLFGEFTGEHFISMMH